MQMKSHVLCATEETRSVEVSKPEVLRPILGPAFERLIHASPDVLIEAVRKYGSPLNIVLPHVLMQNVEALRAVLHRHKVGYEIFYGAKVNKSPGLVRAAVEAGIGVDVSSIYEMRDALHAGIDPSRLCATGPAKTRLFHVALITHAALISVDSIEELDDLEAIVREIQPSHPVRVLLRYRPDRSASSRFGMEADTLVACLERLASLQGAFSFEGFHFHLSGYDDASRVKAMRELVYFVDVASRMGIEPTMIDIGGGLPVQYVDSDAYAAFLEAQHNSHYRNGKMPASFYPYGGQIDACEWIDRFLASPCVETMSIAEYLNAKHLTLAIEPGRSLADQTALSVFRVTRVKLLAADKAVAFVEGSSFSACETWFASEFLVDPILISTSLNGEHEALPTRVWIAGHSCLDEDVITHRLIHFSRRPREGDLLVYANTAGYQMDLLENEFHRHPMPRRISVSFDAAGGMQISPDDRMEYSNDFK